MRGRYGSRSTMTAVPQATISPLSWPTAAASKRAPTIASAPSPLARRHPRDRCLARRGERFVELAQRVAVAEGVQPRHDVAVQAASPHREPEHEPERRDGALTGDPPVVAIGNHPLPASLLWSPGTPPL